MRLVIISSDETRSGFWVELRFPNSIGAQFDRFLLATVGREYHLLDPSPKRWWSWSWSWQMIHMTWRKNIPNKNPTQHHSREWKGTKETHNKSIFQNLLKNQPRLYPPQKKHMPPRQFGDLKRRPFLWPPISTRLLLWHP